MSSETASERALTLFKEQCGHNRYARGIRVCMTCLTAEILAAACDALAIDLRAQRVEALVEMAREASDAR